MILSHNPANPNHPDIRNQRVLVISSLFPPDILGGAEMSAYNLAHWLRRQGAIVGVLTTAKTPEEAHEARDVEGLKVWRIWMPRRASMYHATRAPWWQKILWHAQDHFDPRNRAIIARVLDDFKPAFINIHLLQGIGYNTLIDIARAEASVLYFLPDLSLACFRMSMFHKGKTCTHPCAPCRISSRCKQTWIQKIKNLRFISPSRANLDVLARYFPIKQRPHAAIMNVNHYPTATVTRTQSETLRLLYVGRLHTSKGLDLLLEAAADLASHYPFTLTIIGSGPEEARLRARYGHLGWCHFTGFITQQDISNIMVSSDLLCIPSLWAENSPGVVIQALSLGLPVMGSDHGGIPELVEHEKNGLLVPPGNHDAWQSSLRDVLQNPSRLDPWRAHAHATSYRFDQDYLGGKLLHFLNTAS